MRRHLGAAVALAAVLIGLWALDRAGGRAAQRARQELAATELARKGLRELGAPRRDARGRATSRVRVTLRVSGPRTCQQAVARALQADPVFRLAAGAAHRLEARCQVRRPGRASPSALVRLQLRLQGPAGTPARTSAHQQQLVGYLALVPPLVAVALALASGRILLSMLLAILCAAFVALAGRPERLAAGVADQLLSVGPDLVHAAGWAFWHYLVEPTFAQFKLQIMAFAAALVGMVAVINRGGGTQGLLSLVGRMQGSPRLARLSVWLMGLVLFFDDCANTLVVGSTARPLTDAARVSREKLAYLVDSTAAPIAGVAFISTWIGFEIGLFQTAADSLGLNQSGFELFWEALGLRFYCWLTLGFVLMTILLGRDFGPMLAAERRALHRGRVQARRPQAAPIELVDEGPPAGLRPAWSVAALPILAVVLGVLGGILWLGHQTAGVSLALREEHYAVGSAAHLRDCFTYAAKEGLQGWALLGAGLLGSALALVLARARASGRGAPAEAAGRRALGLPALLRVYGRGARAIGGAIGILIGAWGIQAACEALGTSVVLTAALSGAMDPTWLPLLIFLASAGIAFATGTSWGTMGILIPAVLPLAHALGGAERPLLLYLSAGAVLDGAIFGDHCSPISDTTVMSSLSSGCHHLDHIRTQLPYAVAVMVLAALLGYVGHAWGLPLWGCYGLSGLALVALLLLAGRRP
jgi:Na+/H+ antiporter NhaC